MKDLIPYAVPFLKMHGLGNDFVIVDARLRSIDMTPSWAVAIGDRNRGVGYDQLAIITSSSDADADVAFWNADGSQADACGNATRCIASLLIEESGAEHVTLRTGRGMLPCVMGADGLISVNMGQPQLDWAQIPLARDVDVTSLPIEGAPGAVGIGNPHMVFDVPDVEALDIASLGPELEHHPLYPERTNVEWATVIDRNTVRMRVWERGGFITQACGSGACATVVALHRNGRIDSKASVQLDGGVLDIDWREDGVWMSGPVARSFTGKLDPDLYEP